MITNPTLKAAFPELICAQDYVEQCEDILYLFEQILDRNEPIGTSERRGLLRLMTLLRIELESIRAKVPHEAMPIHEKWAVPQVAHNDETPFVDPEIEDIKEVA